MIMLSENSNIEIGNLRSENNSLRVKVNHLQSQIEWFQRQVFGRKSERLTDFPLDIPDLPGLDFSIDEEEIPESLNVPSHQRKKKSGKGKWSVEIPDDLPRVEEIMDVPEEDRICPLTGKALKKIGEDRVEKLAFRPGEYYVKAIVRPKYAHPNDPRFGVIQENAPKSILAGSKFDESFMAHVAVEKFVYHMPLYRIEEKLNTRMIKVSRQSLSSLLKNIGEKLSPLYDLMKEQILDQGCMFTDDTPVSLLQKGKCIQSRMWVYAGGKPNAPPYHIYEFTKDRSHRHPLKFFEKYKGLFHSDAFGAYEKIALKDDIVWSSCWVHARRYFEKESEDKEFRLWVLQQMRKLFLYERVAWKNDAKKRLAIRDEREKPIVDELFKKFKEKISSGNIRPTSSTATAIGYMLSREKYFRTYLDQSDARMDNNVAERAIRKLVIGRKNWLFIGSQDSGKATATLLSLIQTCRAMNINPQDYLEDVFRRMLDHPAKKLEEFLPDKWQKLRLQK